MKKIKNKFRAIFDGLETAADKTVEIHFHEDFYREENSGKTFGASAIVENSSLIGKLKRIEAGTEIFIETETSLSETELKTVLINCSRQTPTQKTAARMSNKQRNIRIRI